MIVNRNHLYCGLMVVGFANGASDQIANAVALNGPIDALFDTLGISLVVWAAAGVAIWLLLQSPDQGAARRGDFVVLGAACVAFLLPVPQLSWLALAGSAFYLSRTSRDGPTRRAATVLGALTIPTLWTRMLFATFSGPILTADAKLISWIVGTRSTGNAIPFADGSGVLFLEPACSSLTNVSLALLCGVVIVNLYGLQWSRTVAATVVAACLTTVVVNVTRIGAIGVLPAYYDVIHGPFGATVAAWVTNLAVVAIYAGGLRPDAPVHA